MKNIRVFLTENFQFLEVKFPIYLNRRVFVMLHVRGFICGGVRLVIIYSLSLLRFVRPEGCVT